MPRQLTRQEAHEFLDSKPGWIVLTTLDPDGFPHTVPLGYFRLGDEILMGVRANTHKLDNIQHNSKVSLLIESGSTLADIRGLMVQGTATVHSEPADILHYSREAAKLRGTPEQDLPTEPRPGAAYIRVTPERIRSWDYSEDARNR
jgi:general stress protein 26